MEEFWAPKREAEGCLPWLLIQGLFLLQQIIDYD
jgi:hypothetical protein